MKLSAIIFLLCASLAANAQQEYLFDQALVAPIPNKYGREAVYTDALAYKLYVDSMQRPAAGSTFASDNDSIVTWTKITADSSGRLFKRGQRRSAFGASHYYYLTYHSDKPRTAILNIKGNSSVIINGVHHTGDPYGSGYLYIPVNLKKGLNELYARGWYVQARMIFPLKEILFNTEDLTLPFIVLGQNSDSLAAAIVIINASNKTISGMSIRSVVKNREMTSAIPDIPAMSSRKVPFYFDGSAVSDKNKTDCRLALLRNNKIAADTTIVIESVNASEQHNKTFTSQIDGSLQYYAVTPSTSQSSDSALFLSVHGAAVEAINQARAYRPKEWGTVVAPTNRRPRGFNWEDWGRLDALEVLSEAKRIYRPAENRIYLTGHSMGGHGTWFLGATYPDKWAGIAPCSGYPTLKGYGSADGLVPDSSNDNMEQMLLRSGNQSDVIKLATNYKPLGVYILHGDSDRVVSVKYARQMRKVLSEFHTDMSYYEYPGGEHWFGDQSVDWKPLFDFFKWHRRPENSSVNNIDFITSNPGISSGFRWASVEQQIHPLQYSRINLQRDKKNKIIQGTTENVHTLRLALDNFSTNDTVFLDLDSTGKLLFIKKEDADSIYLVKQNNKWTLAKKPAASLKGPIRNGTFKDAFNHRMVFVYGTIGNKAENEWSYNKAKYDAETWLYRGNGTVDLLPDRQFSAEKYKDRGVILFGNRSTNSAWKALLSDCPIQVDRGQVSAADKTWKGDSYGAYFVWPRRDSDHASVGVITGTGIKGMNAAMGNQYFAGASGFPDFMLFDISMLRKGVAGVVFSGFFDNEWKFSPTEYVLGE